MRRELAGDGIVVVDEADLVTLVQRRKIRVLLCSTTSATSSSHGAS